MTRRVSNPDLITAGAAALVSAAVGLVLVLGWLYLHRDLTGGHNAALGLATLLLATTLLLAGVMWATAASRKRTEAERQQKAETLRESDRTVFEHSPEAMVLFDPQGNLVDANRKAVELLRYAREDCLHKHFSELPFWKAETQARLGQQFSQRLAGAEVPPYELEFRRRDGAQVICTVHGTVLWNDDGGIRHVLMILSDVTARKQTEDALRSARDRLQHILDIAGVMFVALDRAGTLTLVNRRACDIFGYREEQLLGKNWFATCVPESIRDEVERTFRVLMAGAVDVVEYYENPIVTSDGDERLIAWHNAVLRDELGAPVGTLSSGEDVTDRRRAEAQLRASEERFQMLFEQAPLGYQSLDESGRLIAVNQRWLELLGYARDEVLGRWFGDFLTPECRGEFQIAFPAFKAAEKMRGTEYQLVCKDGSRRRMSFDGNVGYDRHGGFRQTHFTMRDVTDQRNAEKQLRQREAELAHVSRVQTVGELGGTLAHELNQPLHAINNYVRGIQRRLERGHAALDKGELVDAIEQVSREVQRAAGIVAHLREFVRARQPRRALVDLGRPLHQAVELLQPAARDKGVTLVIETPAGSPGIHVDAIQIEQVLVNLLANAIEAVSGLPDERRQITVASRLAAGDVVEIVVRDDGRGVPEQLRDKMFGAFVTTKEHGLGLGLAISRSIVESHGGKIWMVPNPPHGTAVHFTLPCSLEKKEADDGRGADGVRGG